MIELSRNELHAEFLLVGEELHDFVENVERF